MRVALGAKGKSMTIIWVVLAPDGNDLLTRQTKDVRRCSEIGAGCECCRSGAARTSPSSSPRGSISGGWTAEQIVISSTSTSSIRREEG